MRAMGIVGRVVFGLVTAGAYLVASMTLAIYFHQRDIPMGDLVVVGGTHSDGQRIAPGNCAIEVTKVTRGLFTLVVRDASRKDFDLKLQVHTIFMDGDWDKLVGQQATYAPEKWTNDGQLEFGPHFVTVDGMAR